MKADRTELNMASLWWLDGCGGGGVETRRSFRDAGSELPVELTPRIAYPRDAPTGIAGDFGMPKQLLHYCRGTV
jgi:hypothetical protein